jgi:hypothetical protein
MLCLNCFRLTPSAILECSRTSPNTSHLTEIFSFFRHWQAAALALFSTSPLQNFRLRTGEPGHLLGLCGSVAACSRIRGSLNHTLSGEILSPIPEY